MIIYTSNKATGCRGEDVDDATKKLAMIFVFGEQTR